MAKIFEQFLGLWNKLNNIQKLSIVVVVIGGLFGIILFTIRGGQPAQALLYSDLSESDAAGVTSYLKENRKPFQLANGGRDIFVAKNMVYETRLELAAAGLPPGGGAGFELFDKKLFGLTDFMQNVNYQRALQGELSRTIVSLDAVDSARVHLVIPKETLFTEDQAEPTASVVLGFKSGGKIKEDQIQGIVHLVASSVENLRPENVTVIDNKGQILSDLVSDSMLKLTASQQNYQRTLESGLEKKVNSLLQASLGPGKASARVSAVINFDQIESNQEQFDAENPVVRSEEREEETSTGSTSSAGGVPGTSSNLAELNTYESAPTGSNSSRTRETINYDLSRTTKRTVYATGILQKLSVAVLIDGVYDEKGTYTARPDEEMAKLTTVVKNAVGFDAKRGDQLDVINVAFDTTAYDREAKAQTRAQWLDTGLNIARYTFYLILFIIFYRFIIHPIGRAIILGTRGIPEPEKKKDLRKRAATTFGDLEVDMAAELGGDMEVSEKAAKSSIMRKNIGEMIMNNPKESAMLIRTWLKEE